MCDTQRLTVTVEEAAERVGISRTLANVAILRISFSAEAPPLPGQGWRRLSLPSRQGGLPERIWGGLAARYREVG